MFLILYVTRTSAMLHYHIYFTRVCQMLVTCIKILYIKININIPSRPMKCFRFLYNLRAASRDPIPCLSGYVCTSYFGQSFICDTNVLYTRLTATDRDPRVIRADLELSHISMVYLWQEDTSVIEYISSALSQRTIRHLDLFTLSVISGSLNRYR